MVMGRNTGEGEVKDGQMRAYVRALPVRACVRMRVSVRAGLPTCVAYVWRAGARSDHGPDAWAFREFSKIQGLTPNAHLP